MEISVYTKYSIAASVAGIGVLIVGVMVYGSMIMVPHEVACTEEAKICSDGSSVARSGPLCAFADCPKTVESTTTVLVPTVVESNLQH